MMATSTLDQQQQHAGTNSFEPPKPSWNAPVDFSTGLLRVLQQRETFGGHSETFRTALHTHSSLLPRLVCESTLEGHEGCVNQVCWNESGTLLASGSDDTRVILWDYATRQKRQVIDTGHVLNIFGVCFVPGTNDHIVASGAMDCDVRIHYAPFRKEETKLFRVHKGRVKDITCSYGVPKVFWSVAEDGTVFQFDIRQLPRTNGESLVTNQDLASGVIVKLGRSRTGRVLRGMGMACHPLDCNQFVLACGDFYTRMYDRRMLRIQRRTTDDSSTSELSRATHTDATIPVEVFAPPHFHLDDWCNKRAQRAHDCCHGTSVQFDHTGTKVLTNYHNDHIYLFEVNHGSKPVGVFQKYHQQRLDQCWRNGMCMDEQFPSFATMEVVRELHSRGVAALLTKNYTKAIDLFCAASSHTGEGPHEEHFNKELYHDLAKAYLGRQWQSDVYLAATYCKRAIEIDDQEPAFWLTYLRALKAGQRMRHVRAIAHGFQKRFPHLVNDVDQFVRDSPRHNAGGRSSRFGGRNSSDSGSGSSHERRRFTSSSDEEEFDDDEEYLSDEYDGNDDSWVSSESSSHDSSARFRLPAMCDANRDDVFWRSRLVNTLHVNNNPIRRYMGYCNMQTDIKEAAFFGQNDAYIVAGSDDGRAYMWETKTGRLVNSIVADEDIVNCVQCHPIDSCLATSGIENVIRLWSPLSEKSMAPTSQELDEMARANQRHMIEDTTRILQVGSSSLIRLLIQAGEEEGVQECTPS